MFRVLYFSLILFCFNISAICPVRAVRRSTVTLSPRHLNYPLPMFTTGNATGRHGLVEASKQDLVVALEDRAQDLIQSVARQASHSNFRGAGYDGKRSFLTLTIRADTHDFDSKTWQSFVVADAFISEKSPRGADYRDVDSTVAERRFQDISDYPNNVHGQSFLLSHRQFMLLSQGLIREQAFAKSVDSIFGLSTKLRDISNNPQRDSFFVSIPLDEKGNVDMGRLHEAVVSSAADTGYATAIGNNNTHQVQVAAYPGMRGVRMQK